MEMNHTQLWERCLEIFRDNLPQEQFDTWFKPATSLSYENNKVTIDVPSPFFVEQYEERFLRLIGPVMKRVYGEGVELYYHFNQIKDRPETQITTRTEDPASFGTSPFAPKRFPDLDPQLNPRYTFENYCASDSNKLARAIGMAIANDPKLKTYNPLFIFGPTGVGKTHLIQAIGIRIKQLRPETRVLYITSRLFESQYTTAANSGKMNDFINFYQSIDVLIIDDIQDLIGKAKTQNAFFHIFNHLHQNQKQLILSSDCRPASMDGMEERLLSRFKWGMTAELERPDATLRRDVLCRKASQAGVELPEEVIDFITSNVTDSIRDLDGTLSSLVGHAAILNQEISMSLARRVVANAVKINRRQVNFEMITQQVTDYYNVDADSIFTSSRKREISDARQIVMYLAKKHTKLPLKGIGTRLSRTHATVLHACKIVEDRMLVDKQLREDIAKIEGALMHKQS